MRILAFDVGGSKISLAIIDEDGKIVGSVKVVATPQNSEDIIKIFQTYADEENFEAVAIATAGIVKDNHLTGKPNNLPAGYENINFGDIFHVPCIIENDANSAAWAEYRKGNLRGIQHGVMLTLGTDVGCGIICNGRLLHGKNGAAGEVSMDFSGNGMRKIASQNKLNEQDCFKIYENMRAGNEKAKQTYYAWEEELISGIRQINQLLDTEVVVLSGSLAKIVDYAKVNTTLKLLELDNVPTVKPAYFGTEAGLIGAALLCADKSGGVTNYSDNATIV